MSSIPWLAQAPPVPSLVPDGGDALVEMVHKQTALVERGVLQPGCAAFFLPASADRKPRGVVLAWHGFTAGPWQLWELARRLADEGFHVVGARLPGHGYAQPERLLKSGSWQRYRSAAQVVLRACRDLERSQGLPLMLVGFSAGAVCALHAAHCAQKGSKPKRGKPSNSKQAQQQRVAGISLVAPYLAPANATHAKMLEVARQTDRLNLLGRVLDRTGCAWEAADRIAARSWGRPGYFGYTYGSVLGLERAKAAAVRSVLKLEGSVRPPMQLVASRADMTVDTDAARQFYARYIDGRQGRGGSDGATTPKQDQELILQQAPHTMLSPHEYPHAERRGAIHEAMARFATACTA